MGQRSLIEEVLRRERLVVVVGLSAVVIAAWLHLLHGTGMDMPEMDGMLMPMSPAWSAMYVALMLTMWVVMMVAMMLPSAAPMILLYGAIARQRRVTGGAVAATGVFTLGYIAVWVAFSIGAVALQFGLDRLAILSPMLRTTNAVVAGVLLVGAGVYQWTPLKYACLTRCRTPLDFVLTNWRPGTAGAFVMGLRHGAYCTGCCWALMLLLFVGGVMNLAWVAGIAIFILAEKILPVPWIRHVAGATLVAWGGAVLVPLFAA